MDSFAITFSNILAPNLTGWREIFVAFDYLEYKLAKSSNRPRSFCYFSSMNAYGNGCNCIHLCLLDTVRLLAVSQFSLQQQTGEYVITIPLNGLALFSTLYPEGTDKYSYSYTHFQNSQDFALNGGVSFNILIPRDHCHAGRVLISA